jgi:hypothetical protein
VGITPAGAAAVARRHAATRSITQHHTAPRNDLLRTEPKRIARVRYY